ncbi:MAG: 16S rRNA (cytosine(1402)-N(4))-methyltransferase RsmH [Pseudomonadota bacterium]
MEEGGEYSHQPVLLDEALKALDITAEGIYLDGTYGRGGHSAAILERLNQQGRLLAIDQDPDAVSAAKRRFEGEQRFSIYQCSFAALKQLTDSLDLTGRIDGLLLDLGVSSPQLDNPQRGFSFIKDGPLDMRMDHSQEPSAAQWLARIDESKLAEVIKLYGEERYARRIAKAIVAARKEQPLTTTLQLADLISTAIPRRERQKHPATRTFQAIRIVINNELQALSEALRQSLSVLRGGGRLVVISFHSLEDRIVKRFIRNHSTAAAGTPRGLPVVEDMLVVQLRALGRVRRATKAECQRNPRARSAILRTAEHL